MINFIKNIIKMNKAKKLVEKDDLVEKLIKEKNYTEATKELYSTLKISEKVKDSKIFNIFRVYLFFLTGHFDDVIKIYSDAIESINSSKNTNINTTNYLMLFIYNLVFISSIIEEDNETKKLMIEKINRNHTDFEQIDIYILNRFPLYDNNKLLEYLKTHPLPEKLDEAKLECLMVNLA